MGVREVAKINSNSSNWKVNDFLNSYIDMGIEPYKRIQDIKHEYGMTILNLASLLYGGVARVDKMKEIFIDGDFEIRYEEKALSILNQLKDFEPYTKQPYARRFVYAFEKLLNGGKYDHKHMIKKLEQSGQKIERIESSKNIILNMEEIYNFKQRERLHIL